MFLPKTSENTKLFLSKNSENTKMFLSKTSENTKMFQFTFPRRIYFPTQKLLSANISG